MKEETILAKRIGTAGQRASYDSSCKRLLSSKKILAWILKACVEEFRDCSVKDIEERYIEGVPEVSENTVHPDEQGEFIHGSNTEDATMTEGTIYYDILFWVVSPKNGEPIRMLINVESQKDRVPKYPVVKRGIYYCGRMISGQYGTVFKKSNYKKLCKVYSIWVFPEPPKYRKNTITGYSIHEWNMVGDVKEPEENFDLLTVLMICLGGPGEKNYDGLLKMLDVLLSGQVQPEKKREILQDEFGITMTKEMEREAMEMCNLSQGIVDRTTIAHIISMMDTLKLSEAECMKALKIPEEQQELYRMMLEEEMAAESV